jgi:radical SAM superfamily enzyme YgiQ (UPF0313 family)
MGANRVAENSHAMEKGQSVEQIYTATERLHRADCVGSLQFGYPGEDRSDIEKTLQMVRDCKPDDIGISISYPCPTPNLRAREREPGRKNELVRQR